MSEMRNLNADTSPGHPATPDPFIDWDPASLAFFKAVKKDLPSGYFATEKGIHWGRPQPQRSVPIGPPICTLFRVKAMTRTSDNQNWASVLEVLTPDRTINQITLSKEMLTAKRSLALGQLQSHGMTFTIKNELFVVDLIQKWQPAARLTSIDRPGWDQDFQTFVLPNGDVVTASATTEAFLYTGEAKASRVGEFETWQSQVSSMCIGNPYLIFGVSLALAGPLLEPMGLDSAVFHLHGDTTIGKSASLRVANSVWRSQILPTWNMTSNGLEGQLSLSNATFLAIDELPLAPGPDFGNDIYMLGNGTGKQRANQTGKAAESAKWKMFSLSSGEHDLATIMKSSKMTVKGGQAVRFVDVSVSRDMTVADGLQGSFSNIYACEDSKSFADTIRDQALAHAGHAGPAFVQRILEDGLNREVLRARMKVVTERFKAHLQAPASTPLKPEIARVLERFAVIALAGELASEFGITQWPTGTADAALDRLVVQWFEDRGGNVAMDPSAAFLRTHQFLATFGDSRFIDLDNLAKDSASQPIGKDLAGYQNADYFYMTRAAFAEAHPDQNTKRMAMFHHEAGYLHPSKDLNFLHKLTLPDKKRPLFYAVSKSILDF